MTGMTPEFDFPYPLGSDPLGNGENRIQELAEAVEDYLAGAWTPYTPSCSWLNGAPTGGYKKIGRVVHYWIYFLLDATVGPAPIASPLQLGLPVPAAATGGGLFTPRGIAELYDSSAGDHRFWFAIHSAFDTVRLYPQNGDPVYDTNPWTWGDNDAIKVTGTYEAAS